MSLLSPLVLSLLLACGEEEAAVEEVQEVVVQPEIPKEPSKKDILKDFKLKLGQGDIEGAVAVLPKDDGASDFNLAGAVGWSKSDTSLAGDHGDWARLIAGDAQGAYDVSTDAGIKALAVVRGAKSSLLSEYEATKSVKKSKSPAPERDWSTEEALELLLATGDEQFLERAKAASSWSGQIGLAEWASAKGDSELALNSFANAAAIEGVGQLYARARHASSTGNLEELQEVIGKASGTGDVIAGTTALNGLIDAHVTNGTLSALWSSAYEALKADHKLKLSDVSWEVLGLTRVALLTGHTIDVRTQVGKLVEQSKGAVQQEAMLYAGIVGRRLMDEGLLSQVEAAGGQAVMALLSDSGTGLDALTSEQQVMVAMTMAPISGTFSKVQLPKILKQDLPLIHQLSLLFLQEDFQRSQGMDTNAMLDGLIEKHSDKPNLQMEVSARKALSDFSAQVVVPATETPSVIEQVWGQLASGDTGKIEPTTRAEKGLIAWKKVIEAQRVGKSIDTELDELWQDAPLHRVGSLATHTSLDLSDGGDVAGLFRAMVNLTGDGQTASSVGLLELARTVEANHREGFAGASSISAIPVDDRVPLLGALETVRAGMQEFWMGGSFPGEAFTKLGDAEKKVMGIPTKSHMFNETVISGKGIREQMKTISSVISIFEHNGEYLAGVVSPNASDAVVLGSAKGIDALVGKHQAALLAGVGNAKINHLPGNDLRAATLQPLADALTGVGKYLVIVPPVMAKFGFSTLPEQKEGLRFFANTPRDITLATSLDSMWSANQVYSDYELDMFAISRTTKEENWTSSVTDAGQSALLTNQGFSPEIGLVKVHFSDSAKVVIRDEATVEAFAKNAPRARYIYLSEVASTPNGGFQMADGELSLDQIANTDLHAMIVFIGPDANLDNQARRVEAFMQAGAQAVIVQSWAIPANDLRILVENLFMNLKRNDPLIIAMNKTRGKYIKESSKEAYENNPGHWGAFTIYSRP